MTKEERIDNQLKNANTLLKAIQEEIRALETEKACLNLTGAEKELYKIGYDEWDDGSFHLREEVNNVELKAQVESFQIKIPAGDGQVQPDPLIFVDDYEGEVKIGVTTIVAMYHLLKERGLVK